MYNSLANEIEFESIAVFLRFMVIWTLNFRANRRQLKSITKHIGTHTHNIQLLILYESDARPQLCWNDNFFSLDFFHYVFAMLSILSSGEIQYRIEVKWSWSEQWASNVLMCIPLCIGCVQLKCARNLIHINSGSLKRHVK